MAPLVTDGDLQYHKAIVCACSPRTYHIEVSKVNPGCIAVSNVPE